MTLFEAEGKELTYKLLVLTPLEHLTREEEDDRYRKHVADDTDDVSGDRRDTRAESIDDAAADLDQRDHRYEE